MGTYPPTLLEYACGFIHATAWDALSQFIDEYPQVATCVDNSGETLLSYLSHHGATAPLLKKLILLGADPNGTDEAVERPIAHTINAGNEWGLDTLDELATLLDMGANPNISVACGYPALHLAIVWNKPRHLALLLEKGADIHSRSFDDPPETLLDVARRVDNKYANEVLRKYGVLPDSTAS